MLLEPKLELCRRGNPQVLLFLYKQNEKMDILPHLREEEVHRASVGLLEMMEMERLKISQPKRVAVSMFNVFQTACASS